MNTDTSKKTFLLVEGALMIAMAFVLSYIKLYDMPMGGSITLEMIPLVIMGLRHGVKWGTFTAAVHGIIQLILGFSNVMYCATIPAMIGCVLLDYLFAFTVLGLAGLFLPLFKNKLIGAAVGTAICGALRFLCSFLSGWLLWGSYAPKGWSVAYYSLIYNGSYMLPNIIIGVIVILIIGKQHRDFYFKRGKTIDKTGAGKRGFYVLDFTGNSVCGNGSTVFEILYVSRQHSSRIQTLLVMLLYATVFNIAGYTLEMQAATKELAMQSLKFTYLGKPFIIFIMYLFVMEYCGVKLSKKR